MVFVRVRGMYATAISKILLDAGFKLVEASEKIRERLGVGFNVSPCDVTVKDTNSPDELLVVGFPREAKLVYETLLKKLTYVFKWESSLDLHGVYLGRVTDKQGDVCTVDVGIAKGYLSPCKEGIGSEVLVGVKKPPVKPGERPQLTKNFRLIGKYLAIVHGDPKITFSDHIVDHGIRAKLTAIATSKLIGTGLGVHFRSSSKYASSDAITSEIENLLAEYAKIVSSAGNLVAPTKLYDGEFIGLLGLTSLAKDILDSIRREVTFTLDRHHSLKSMDLGERVDFAEYILSEACKDVGEISQIGVANYIARKLLEVGILEFFHIKPTGETIRLKPGRVLEVRTAGRNIILVARRTIESRGVYDGLGVEKRPEDLDYVLVNTSMPILSHNYYRGDRWIGSYININTPPEVGLGLVKYHDLLVDVVVYPDGDVKVIDIEELERFHKHDVIPAPLYRYALDAVEQVLANPINYVYNPSLNLRK